MAVITNTTSVAWPVSDGVTDGKWAVLSLDCAFSWVGEVFIWTQIGWDCCLSFCWDCLGELGFWCRQPGRSDTNLMLWFIERVYLWVGRGFPEINRIFLFSVILGGCEGQLLDQGNSSWDLEESWTSPTQSYLPWLQTQSLVRVALNSWVPEIWKALSWEGSKYIWPWVILSNICACSELGFW